MGSIDEMDFRLKVTRIKRKSIDRLVDLADSELEIYRQRLDSSVTGKDADIDPEAFQYVYIDSPKIAFSLYALAIVHCYSIAENNRKLICSRITGLNRNQRRNLHKINVVSDCLRHVGINHENVRCYKTMEEFRMVNNAIKHDRYSLSTSITAKNQKNYGLKQLRGLYSNRAKHLETYLSDLDKRVSNKI